MIDIDKFVEELPQCDYDELEALEEALEEEFKKRDMEDDEEESL